MNDRDKKDIRQIFNEGIEQLVLPILDDIYKNMATKKELHVLKQELKGDISDVHNDIGSIDSKLNAEILWRDKAEKRIKNVEIKLEIAK